MGFWGFGVLGFWGGRNRTLVDARHPPGRQYYAAVAHQIDKGYPRPQHQRLSAAPGPLLPRLYRRRHVRARHRRQGQPEENLVLDQLAALYRLHAHHGAAVRPRPDAGDRRIDREQCQGLAEADLGARRARQNQSGSDLHLSAARSRVSPRPAASAPTTSTRTCRCRRRGSPTRSCSARSSTAGFAPTTFPMPISRRSRRLHAAGAGRRADRHDPAQRRFVDERGIVYTVDRHVGGLYILEMDF